MHFKAIIIVCSALFAAGVLVTGAVTAARAVGVDCNNRRRSDLEPDAEEQRCYHPHVSPESPEVLAVRDIYSPDAFREELLK